MSNPSVRGTDTPRPIRRLTAPAAVFAVALVIAGCSSDSNSSPSSPSGISTSVPVSDVTGLVSANHGHVALLTAVQIRAATDVTVDIQGTASHSHTVSLTAAQVTDIGRGRQVAGTSTTSTIGGVHQHLVSFN